jgi:tyrosinase
LTRWFTWTWEKALREECGYPGYQPYINWGRYALDLVNAPIFDGSDLSIGGNGVFVNHSAINIPSDALPYIQIPPGTGGGCIKDGPFRNMSVNLGPVSPVLKNISVNPQPDGLGYNPRCLRRDISQYAAQNWVQDQNVTDLITQSPNISAFQTTLQGNFPVGFLGVHTGGHMFVAGDPGGDLFSSPGDPWWYLQHSQIDRIWWIWQNQDPANRIHTIGDTITLNNSPPSRNATLEDVIDLGVNAPESVKLADLVDTQAGPFCYTFE